MRKLLILIPLVWMVFCSNKSAKRPSMLGKPVNDFSLRSTTGEMVSQSSYPDAKGFIIIFTCNHCPFAKLYTTRLNELSKKYTPLGLPLFAINSMDTSIYAEEKFELMKKKAATEHYAFPYLADGSQQVLKMFNAAHTPQAFIIWKEGGQWIVKYSGAIDDNGQHPEQANSFISLAADELLAGKPLSKPETLSFGCAIYYRQTATPQP